MCNSQKVEYLNGHYEDGERCIIIKTTEETLRKYLSGKTEKFKGRSSYKTEGGHYLNYKDKTTFIDIVNKKTVFLDV